MNNEDKLDLLEIARGYLAIPVAIALKFLGLIQL